MQISPLHKEQVKGKDKEKVALLQQGSNSSVGGSSSHHEEDEGETTEWVNTVMELGGYENEEPNNDSERSAVSLSKSSSSTIIVGMILTLLVAYGLNYRSGLFESATTANQEVEIPRSPVPENPIPSLSPISFSPTPVTQNATNEVEEDSDEIATKMTEKETTEKLENIDQVNASVTISESNHSTKSSTIIEEELSSVETAETIVNNETESLSANKTNTVNTGDEAVNTTLETFSPTSESTPPSTIMLEVNRTTTTPTSTEKIENANNSSSIEIADEESALPSETTEAYSTNDTVSDSNESNATEIDITLDTNKITPDPTSNDESVDVSESSIQTADEASQLLSETTETNATNDTVLDSNESNSTVKDSSDNFESTAITAKATFSPTTTTFVTNKPSSIPTSPEKNENGEDLTSKQDAAKSLPSGVENEVEFVEVPFNDLHYRRVCANVGASSILCMIIRYPFEVPLQDPGASFPKPVDDRFYHLDRNNLIEVDGKEMLTCAANIPDGMETEEAVKVCIENVLQSHADNPPVITVWTRKQQFKNEDGGMITKTIFHGTSHKESIQRVYDFFGHNHEILVAGASPSPGIAACMEPLFGDCRRFGLLTKGNKNCDQPHRRKLPNKKFSQMSREDEEHINIGPMVYSPESRNGNHWMGKTTLLEELQLLRRSPGWTSLRNYTHICEYPFAHVQTQDMIYHKMHDVEKIAREFPARNMELLSENGTEALAKLGYVVRNLIVFDGLPQFNPSETGGYVNGMKDKTTFANGTGYEGWREELGTSCRGPLPMTSKLKEINNLARERFKELGFDMRWYGKTWEFANQFWWQTRMWGGKGGQLDCTHSGGKGGLYCTHRFFLQAMIDDYFENQP